MRRRLFQQGQADSGGVNTMVTIQDVAKLAGVPEKTAARALAGLTMGKRRDARERAERVLKAAAELGYEPSNIARALRQGRTKTLGLITGRLTNLYFAAVAEVAMDEAARAGYRLLIEISRWESERTYHCVKDFLSYRVDGLLFTSSVPSENAHFYKLLADRHFPLVALLPGTLNFTSVFSDYTETFPEAIRYLAERGNRSVLFVLPPGRAVLNKVYSRNFEDACKAAGIRGELVDTQNFEDVDVIPERMRPESVVIFGKYSLKHFVKHARMIPGYRPDIIGFYNEWTWSEHPEEVVGVLFANEESLVRTAVRELIAQIELKVPVHNISFSTEFYPMERFHEIKALNLDLDYLS